jgi:Raf kinase inhibitor-like YbhB/YbcL family protein
MKLTSTAFGEGEAIPVKYSGEGANVNPPLAVVELPEGTAALVLVMDDPDAPKGTFDHWVLWNAPADIGEVPEDWQPASDAAGVTLGVNGRGELQYMGPQPPSGTHRYFFKAYALDERVDLARGASKGELEQAMEGHVLDKAELMGTFTKGA